LGYLPRLLVGNNSKRYEGDCEAEPDDQYQRHHQDTAQPLVGVDPV
jgi:hypothetical protein